jgi:hypothetical protein
MTMTEAEKELRAIKRAQQAAEAAAERSRQVEKAQLKEIRSVWKHIPDELRRVFKYIESEIPKRDSPKEVAFLRETRAIHFRPFRKFLKGDKA